MRHNKIWTYVDEAARAGSLRGAAETLNVTPSALQRRIQDLEEDLGFAIFERSARGVRLTTAGEGLIHWIRTQAAELERLRSHVTDMKGLRRGTVRIACSQALAQAFMPQEIARFRAMHPGVRFVVEVCDHGRALNLVRSLDTDLAVVVWPDRRPDFQPLMSIGQTLFALMAAHHPLAARRTVRLRECADYPVALPTRGFGSRALIDSFLTTSSVDLRIDVEANSFELLRGLVLEGDLVTFQVGIGAMPERLEDGVVARPIDDADAAHGPLVLGQLRGRTLPVAAARFGEALSARLDTMRSLPMWSEKARD